MSDDYDLCLYFLKHLILLFPFAVEVPLIATGTLNLSICYPIFPLIYAVRFHPIMLSDNGIIPQHFGHFPIPFVIIAFLRLLLGRLCSVAFFPFYVFFFRFYSSVWSRSRIQIDFTFGFCNVF